MIIFKNENLFEKTLTSFNEWNLVLETWNYYDITCEYNISLNRNFSEGTQYYEGNINFYYDGELPKYGINMIVDDIVFFDVIYDTPPYPPKDFHIYTFQTKKYVLKLNKIEKLYYF